MTTPCRCLFLPFLVELLACPSLGLLPIDSEQITVGGLSCDMLQGAMVYYPTGGGKYPLLSFAHGFTEGGFLVGTNYKDVLETVAAAGYIVIAEESGLSTLCFAAEKRDQLRAIDYVKASPDLSAKVDWKAGVGLYGHSMGGGATGLNVADQAAVQAYNVGAAVCLHPASVCGLL